MWFQHNPGFEHRREFNTVLSLLLDKKGITQFVGQSIKDANWGLWPQRLPKVKCTHTVKHPQSSSKQSMLTMAPHDGKELECHECSNDKLLILAIGRATHIAQCGWENLKSHCKLSRYGIDWFGKNVGFFGVLQLPIVTIGIIGYYDFIDSSNNMNLNTLRLIRSSLWKFSQTIVKERCLGLINKYDLTENDALFWKYSSLIVLGMINFYTMNMLNRKIPSNINEVTHEQVSQSYYIIKLFINRFVINLIAPNLIRFYKLFKISNKKIDLTVIHLFDSLFRKQLIDILDFWQKLNANKQFDSERMQVKSRSGMLKNIAMLQNLLVLSPINDCDTYKIVKNARLNQYNCLLKYVLNEDSRDQNLFTKWKNVTIMKACNHCGKKNKTLKKCRLCVNHQMYYCSRKCQKKDWNSAVHRHRH